MFDRNQVIEAIDDDSQISENKEKLDNEEERTQVGRCFHEYPRPKQALKETEKDNIEEKAKKTCQEHDQEMDEGMAYEK